MELAIRAALHRLLGAYPPPILVETARSHMLIDGCEVEEAARRAVWDAVTEYAAGRGDVWSSLEQQAKEQEP